jgi:hypothetical protein
MKGFELKKSEFEFRNDDVSCEFNEYIDYVFHYKDKLYFVFKKGFKNKNPRSHIKKYYKSLGYTGKNIKFLKQ